MKEKTFKKAKKSAAFLAGREVVFLKILIIFVIALVPVSFMVLDVVGNLGKLTQKTGKNSALLNFRNLGAKIPASQVGDISLVPQAEINGLFSNLKH